VISFESIFGINSLDNIGEKCFNTPTNVSHDVIVPSKSQKTIAERFSIDITFFYEIIFFLRFSFSIGRIFVPIISLSEDVADE
jgi:hypothetical protein